MEPDRTTPHRADTDIDAVIFDFTGVLSTSPAPALLGGAVASGIDLHDFLPIALGPLDEDGDHPWHELERGRITLAEYARAVEPLWRASGVDAFPMVPSGDELFRMLEPQPAMIDLARDLRAAGYGTAIVTNNIREWSQWRSLWDADALVDVVVDSSEVGIRKPNRAIFELVLQRLGGVSAARALFLDDFPWNVAGAEAAGLQAMLVADAEVTAAEVRTRLLGPAR